MHPIRKPSETTHCGTSVNESVRVASRNESKRTIQVVRTGAHCRRGDRQSFAYESTYQARSFTSPGTGRQLRLFPRRRNTDGSPALPTQPEIDMILNQKELLADRRRQLSDVSW
jgi:hypothetical protein